MFDCPNCVMSQTRYDDYKHKDNLAISYGVFCNSCNYKIALWSHGEGFIYF